MNDDGDHHLRSLVQIQAYTSAESLLRVWSTIESVRQIPMCQTVSNV